MIGEVFGHDQLRSSCFQVQLVNKLLTSFGSPLLNWGVFYKFLCHDR